MLIIANLIKSAADPWQIVFTAWRSARARSPGLALVMAGKYRRLPKIVSMYPAHLSPSHFS
jgi:hypothetical protein